LVPVWGNAETFVKATPIVLRLKQIFGIVLQMVRAVSLMSVRRPVQRTVIVMLDWYVT